MLDNFATPKSPACECVVTTSLDEYLDTRVKRLEKHPGHRTPTEKRSNKVAAKESKKDSKEAVADDPGSIHPVRSRRSSTTRTSPTAPHHVGVSHISTLMFSYKPSAAAVYPECGVPEKIS
jgi:hypothetical protein